MQWEPRQRFAGLSRNLGLRCAGRRTEHLHHPPAVLDELPGLDSQTDEDLRCLFGAPIGPALTLALMTQILLVFGPKLLALSRRRRSGRPLAPISHAQGLTNLTVCIDINPL